MKIPQFLSKIFLYVSACLRKYLMLVNSLDWYIPICKYWSKEWRVRVGMDEDYEGALYCFWNWSFIVIKTIKRTLVRPLKTSFKMTVLCLHVAPPLSLWKLLPSDCWGWGQSWPLDRSLPFPPVAIIQNEANFPFHQPCL